MAAFYGANPTAAASIQALARFAIVVARPRLIR
jgi:hypothetical protein